jgi:hypothetical protein
VSTELLWPWVAILLLGGLHGLNPGMGWLFAAALGMQEGRGSAAWRALPPLALGHALAVGVALLPALALGLVVSTVAVQRVVGVVLIAYGVFRFLRNRHPTWGGMRVGMRDLTIWSFLMASAHGAGLMVLPFIMAEAHGSSAGAGHHAHVSTAGVGGPEGLEALVAVVLHTGAYLLVTGLLAVVVVSWLGLRLLGRLWIDLDRIWAGALVLTGVVTLLL